MKTYATFAGAKAVLTEDFKTRSYSVHSGKWQAVDISKKPEMEMREMFSTSFQIPLRGLEDIDYWQKDIMPNLPFADVHFQERIGGVGTNPGEAWKIWPWGNAADAHRTESGKFTHTYQERFWPNSLEGEELENGKRWGLRYPFGDLNDLLRVMLDDPEGRQAYLPIWFPEDLACAGRKPCTLGYHFMLRHDYLHLTYHIRSCDFIRHWQDDCYLAVRLLLHVLEALRNRDERWRSVRPGMYVMHIASLHMFINDWRKIGGR